MRILVTGGAGFIGSHVAECYKNAGHDVAILDNFSSGKRANITEGITVFEADITNSTAVHDILTTFQPEIINHHAAQISVTYSVREPLEDAQKNILGTITLLEAVVNMPIAPKIIYAASGGSMYGDVTVLPVVETMEARPASPYGLSKYTAEQYVWLYSRLHGLRATVLRYSNVFGPRQDPHGEAGVCAVFTRKFLAHEQPVIFGDGTQTRDYVYVEDVTTANLAALECGDGEALHIATGHPTSTLEVFEALRDATDSAIQPQHAARRPGELQHMYLANQKASTVLGWQPNISFQEGIAKTIAWCRNQV